MLIDWTKHIKDPEEKSKYEDSIRSCRVSHERLIQILSDWEKSLDRIETSIKVYDTPNWDVRQAHKNGNREIIAKLTELIRSTYDR